MDFPSSDYITNLGFSAIFAALMMAIGRFFFGYKQLTMPAIIFIIVGCGIVYIRNQDGSNE
jgi:Ca2+-dependent lipid-binding protein